MATIVDVGGPAAAPAAQGRTGRRRWIVLGVVAAVAVASGAYLLRHQPATPEEFTTFAQRLDALPAPAGAWTSYDPSATGYAAAPDQGWHLTGAGTWSNTQDPSSWVAVHGWQTTVATASASTACRAAVDWLASTAAALDLPSSDSPPTTARCLAVVATAVGTSGSSSDAWAGQGLQHADAELRYRSGSIISTQESVPGRVTIAVMADATVFGH